jgi:hypothetical protein
MTSATPVYNTVALILVGTIAGFLIGRITTTANSPPQPITTTESKAAEESGPKRASLPDSTYPKSVAKIIPETQEPEPFSDSDDGELAEFPGNHEECKLVLVVRTDLGMTKGMHPA